MVARAILPHMLTEADTKRPVPIGKLSETTGLEPQVILGCLLDLELSGYVRQISRPAEIANRVWEVSHDFVARLLGPILKTPFQTFWGRLGLLLYPLSLGVWGLAAFGLFLTTSWLKRMHSEQILRDRFSIFLHDEGNGYLAREQDLDFQDLTSAVPYLVDFGSVTALELTNCSKLVNVDALKDLKALHTLSLQACSQLTNVDGVKDLKALKTLDLSRCEQLANVDALRNLKALQTLNLMGCRQLVNVDVLKDLRALEALYLWGSAQLANVDALKDLKDLHILFLVDCTPLANVDVLRNLKALQTLYLRSTQLTNIDGLKDLRNMQSLWLGGCTQLANVDALKDLKALQTLNLHGCTQLANIDGLKDLKALQNVDLGGCTQLSPEAVNRLRAALPQTEIAADK
jgi:hypothetical protein